MNMKISILMSSYNSERYISETLDSIISQTYKNWELLVINDGSTDNSLCILKKYEFLDKRIKVTSHDINVGKGEALNFLIDKATGSFIAFIDADDIWISNKLELQLARMVEEKFSFSFTAYMQFDCKSGNLLRKIPAMQIVTYNDMIKYSRIGFSTVMISAKLLKKRQIPPLRKRQDYAMWLMLLKDNNAYGIDIPLTKYRVSEKSLSSNKIEMIKWHWILYTKIENMSYLQSLYYLLWDIYSKLAKLK